MSTRWIEVDLPFAIRTSPEMNELNSKFIKVVGDAKNTWRLRFPDIARLEQTDPNDFTAAFEVQDKYPWLRGHLAARENPELWRDESLARVEEAPVEYRSAFKNLILHRYAYVRMTKFIDTFPDVLQIQNDIALLREKEHSMQFCNHPACAVGVLIDVRSTKDGVTSRSVMLIGDVTPNGLDDGCCSSGLKDDDLIVSYCDLRPTLEEAFKCLT